MREWQVHYRKGTWKFHMQTCNFETQTITTFSMTSSYLCISYLQQDRRYLFWVVKTHTCARRKTAHVRTAAVVSCPAISIVIKSSLSCPKKLVTVEIELCNKLLTLHEFWSTKNIPWIPSCIPLCYWGIRPTCINKTHKIWWLWQFSHFMTEIFLQKRNTLFYLTIININTPHIN